MFQRVMVVIGIGSLCAGSAMAQPRAFPEAGLKIMLPKDYTEFSKSFVQGMLQANPALMASHASYLCVVGKLKSDSAPNISIATAPTPYAELPGNFIEAMEQRSRGQNPTYQVLSSGYFNLNGARAAMINATYISTRPGRTNGRKILLCQVVTQRNDRCIYFTFGAFPEDFDEAKGAFAQMLKSVHWTNKHG